MTGNGGSLLSGGSWQDRMAAIVETMREMSRQKDPQEMVRAYSRRMSKLMPTDGFVSLSRRDLKPPRYRVTRNSRWKEDINPWKSREKLPLFDRGLLGELLYESEPRVINDLRIAPDDPAATFLGSARSLIAVPLFDQGVALNMVFFLRNEPAGFDPEQLPELVWMSNLFGKATNTLVLAEKLESAYVAIDRELKLVADIQRSLLPAQLPQIPNMHLVAHYQTSQRAGGDYYDFFPLDNGKWGILIADVSGHGTPAAVVMAMTQTIAHLYAGPNDMPGTLLEFLNNRLATPHMSDSGTFVTAFYAIYDPKSRKLVYANAGHNPPRLMRCASGEPTALDRAPNLPLGVKPDISYENSTHSLLPGDRLVFYTDGVVEARNADDRMFGTERLDRILSDCSAEAGDVIEAVLSNLETFTDGQPAADDITILAARVI